MATTTALTAGQTTTPDITLTATEMDTVTFILFTPYIEVISDGAAHLWFTVDGSAAGDDDANAYYMPAAASSRTVRLGPSLGRNPTVKLYSTGTPKYTVTAVAQP